MMHIYSIFWAGRTRLLVAIYPIIIEFNWDMDFLAAFTLAYASNRLVESAMPLRTCDC